MEQTYTKARSVALDFAEDELVKLMAIAGRCGIVGHVALVGDADGVRWNVRWSKGQGSRWVMAFNVPELDAPESGPALVDQMAWAAMVGSSVGYFERTTFGRWCSDWEIASRSVGARWLYQEAVKTDRKLRRFLGEAEYGQLRALGYLPRARRKAWRDSDHTSRLMEP